MEKEIPSFDQEKDRGTREGGTKGIGRYSRRYCLNGQDCHNCQSRISVILITSERVSDLRTDRRADIGSIDALAEMNGTMVDVQHSFVY